MKRMRLRLAVTAVSLAIGALCNGRAAGTDYHVDFLGGDDTNSGTSPSTAWKNVTRVSSTTFSAGDRILLKRGAVWNGQRLAPKGSGLPGRPIVIDCYGDVEDALPLLNGNGVVQDVIYLHNREYWEISNLEISNYREGDVQYGDNSNVKRGVYVLAENCGALHHIHIKNLVIHDINAVLGPDQFPSKNTGGIFFDAIGPAPTWYDDLLVEGCHIYNVDRGGISNLSDWMNRTVDDDTGWVASQNVVIRGNVFEHIGGNGLIIRAAQSPLVEYNQFGYCGEDISGNAMFFSYCNDPVAQYNEAYAEVYEPGETDAAGFDDDLDNKRALWQYNYAHDNGQGGFTLMTGTGSHATDFGVGAIVRYNICQNNDRRTIYVSGHVKQTQIYNNVFFLGPEVRDNLIIWHRTKTNGGPEHTAYYNNIFYNLGANNSYRFDTSTDNLFSHNVFYGNHPADEPVDIYKLTRDPMLIAPGTGGLGRHTLAGYQLMPGSPCIDSGRHVPDDGQRDYWGNPVPFNGKTDRGAHEWTPPDPNDQRPPTPDPMTWDVVPATQGARAVTMTATQALDPSGVQYYFANVTSPRHDSGWRTGPHYRDEGLEPDTEYIYRVKARDQSAGRHETAWSMPVSVATPSLAGDETILETFDVNPVAHGWVDGSAAHTTFTYSDEQYLDARIWRDEHNPARFSKALEQEYRQDAEFWFQMDCQFLGASAAEWGMALVGVFGGSDNDHDFLGCRFASPAVGNRYDLWRYDSAGARAYWAGPAPIPDDAIVRVQGHYWCQEGIGYGELKVFDLNAEVYSGGTGVVEAVPEGASLVFRSFGLGNRTDGTLHGDVAVKIDNLYFSLVAPHAGRMVPSFEDFLVRGDFELDGSVDVDDVRVLAGYWLAACSDPDWCGGCDANRDGIVNISDLDAMAANWMLSKKKVPEWSM